MRRRSLLVLPLLAALPAPGRARPLHADASWPELRLGGAYPDGIVLSQALGTRVLVSAEHRVPLLDRGHLELALLTAPELATARRLMGARLVVLEGSRGGLHLVSRTVLSPDLRAAMAAALRA